MLLILKVHFSVSKHVSNYAINLHMKFLERDQLFLQPVKYVKGIHTHSKVTNQQNCKTGKK